MPTKLMRDELFNQVWKRPMTKVAAEYGISDFALKNICVKHRIPVPGRGHCDQPQFKQAFRIFPNI